MAASVRSGVAAVLVLWCAGEGATAGQDCWTSTNPGAGGAFSAVGAGPTGVIIACGDLSGAYRSLDRGRSWDAIGYFRGLNTTHASAVGFDPIDENIIYIGTDSGIFRSADGGLVFQQVLSSGYINDVKFAAGNPTVGYAARHSFWNSTNGEVIKSTDRGSSWSLVSTNLPAGLRILKLLVDPSDANTLYLVSGQDWFANGQWALFKSTDGGVNWGQLGADLGQILDVALDPANPQVLYTTTYVDLGGSAWTGDVYKSTDGGATWTRKVSRTGAILVQRDQPEIVRVIDVYRRVWEEEAGVWESTDGGDTWILKGPPDNWDPGWQDRGWTYGTGHGVPKTLGEDLSDPDAIYWVDGQFVYGSFDGGATFEDLYTDEVTAGWWRSRGIENICPLDVVISPADPRRIYAGSLDIGFWRSVDGGETWQSGNHPEYTGAWLGYGGDTLSILADPARPDVVWATMGEDLDAASLVKSEEAGAADSWIDVSGGLEPGFFSGLSMDSNSPVIQRRLLVTYNGDVYRSDDDALTWSLILSGNPCRFTAFDRFDGNLVYAGGESGLWRSAGGGDPGSWQQVGPAEFAGSPGNVPLFLGWGGIHGIETDPSVPGGVFVVSHGDGEGLYRSVDSGDTWEKLLTDSYLRGVAAPPAHPRVIYVTSSSAINAGGGPWSSGVSRSTDGGRTWQEANDGLAWPFAGPIAIDPLVPSTVLIGSTGTGMQRRSFDGGDEVPTTGGWGLIVSVALTVAAGMVILGHAGHRNRTERA